MTDEKPTADDRMAAREAQRDQLRAALDAVDLDGPHELPTGGGMFNPLGAMFGGGPRSSYAICLRCGVVVMLGDPEERPDGPPVERGVRLHTAWHQEEHDAHLRTPPDVGQAPPPPPERPAVLPDPVVPSP